MCVFFCLFHANAMRNSVMVIHSIKLSGGNSLLSSCFPLVPFNHRHGTKERERLLYKVMACCRSLRGERERGRDESSGLLLYWSAAENFLVSLFSYYLPFYLSILTIHSYWPSFLHAYLCFSSPHVVS